MLYFSKPIIMIPKMLIEIYEYNHYSTFSSNCKIQGGKGPNEFLKHQMAEYGELFNYSLSIRRIFTFLILIQICIS